MLMKKMSAYKPIMLAAIVLAIVALFGFSRIAHAAPYEVVDTYVGGGEFVARTASVVTGNPSVVGSTSATLNGHYDAGDKLSTSFASLTISFEYGVSRNELEYGTNLQKLPITATSGSYSAALAGLEPNTRYYYRAVGVSSGKKVVGETVSFVTQSKSTASASASSSSSGSSNTSANNVSDNQSDATTVLDTILSGGYASTNTSSSGTTSSNASGQSSSSSSANTASSNGTASSSYARLSITDDESRIARGDRIAYTVTYEARQSLRDAKLVVTLPKGVVVQDSSRGSVDKSDSRVTIDLGDLSKGAKRTIDIDARVTGSYRDGQNLKTTAELSFGVGSSSTIRSVEATDTTEFMGGSSALGASLFGANVSLSFFAWLVIAGIIALIIVIARKQAQKA